MLTHIALQSLESEPSPIPAPHMPNRERGTLRIPSWAVSTTDPTLGGWQFFEITRSKLVPYLSREPREGTCHIQGHTARQQQDTHHPHTLPTPMTSLRWLPSGLTNVVLPAILYLPKSFESSKIHMSCRKQFPRAQTHAPSQHWPAPASTTRRAWRDDYGS